MHLTPCPALKAPAPSSKHPLLYPPGPTQCLAAVPSLRSWTTCHHMGIYFKSHPCPFPFCQFWRIFTIKMLPFTHHKGTNLVMHCKCCKLTALVSNKEVLLGCWCSHQHVAFSVCKLKKHHSSGYWALQGGRMQGKGKCGPDLRQNTGGQVCSASRDLGRLQKDAEQKL